MTIGIDHMAFYAPHQYISLKDLADARGVDPLKYTVGIGIEETSVATPVEDIVVLAANSGWRVLQEAGVSPDEVGMLIVGTESAIDKSKPTATHVHELLGINQSCRVYDIVHACAGATYGILSAIDWLQHQDHKYALVIAADIARYPKNSLGEPTQGAGSVAMLMSRSPRLLSLEEVGNYSQNVYDFWKPLDSIYPIVDGVHSAQCYGLAAEGCFKDLELSETAAYLYHVPYPKLVQQTHTRITRLISKNIDPDQHYRERVASAVLYPSKIGNIYTGSLWLALISFLGNYQNSNASLESLFDEFDGCYLFSYGSGCGAELMRGHFSKTWAEQSAKFKFEEWLKNRTKLTVQEYEEFLSIFESSEAESEQALKQFETGGRFRYLETKNEKRCYGINHEAV